MARSKRKTPEEKAAIQRSIDVGPHTKLLTDAAANMHRFAWREGAPIDVQAGEQRPRWINGREAVS
jgi:hypothetical protein